jgi:hypothetical protein
MLHKDYDRKVSGRESQGAWRQDELIDGKPTVVIFESGLRGICGINDLFF